MKRFRNLAFAAIAIAGFFYGCGRSFVSSQEPVLPEFTVKAAFLYNFAKLVDWPTNTFASGQAPLVIAVLGKDPFGAVLDNLVKDKRINGHNVQVRRFEQAEDVRDCHVLYISGSEKKRMPAILAALRGRNILTVAETEEFTAVGGMIQLLPQAEMIRFQINTNATREAGLQLSSRLLQLAINLRPSGAKGGK